MSYKLIIIGTSAGGINALKQLLSKFENSQQIPIIVLQHLSSLSPSYLSSLIHSYSKRPTFEVEDKMEVENGNIYVPAPNYHMLMEKDWTLSLNVEKRVSYARPSIDVLFESVADACHESVIAILLTGANQDGANGIKVIKEKGGYTMVQDPKTAYAKEMPEAAIKMMNPDFIGSIDEIKIKLEHMINETNSKE